MATKKISQTTREARGASIVELVLVLPLLITIVLMVADLGRAFSQYATLTWIAEEGARFASRVGQLESNQLFQSSIPRPRGGTLQALNPVSPATFAASRHAGVHSRIENLLRIEDQNSQLPLRLTNIEVSSEHIPAGTGGEREDTIRIALSGQYESLFPLSKVILGLVIGTEGIPVRTQVDVPYLF